MARNWMGFDEFSDRRGADSTYVTMNHKGEIVINRYTFKTINEPDAVVMLFDPETDTIGLRPASPQMPNAFLVRLRTECGHRVICARPFAKKHDIRLDHTLRFREPVFEDGILILDLRNMINAARGPRKLHIRR